MPTAPEPVTVACHAMATRFEIVLFGGNPASLRAAGEEALAEIERIENALSLFRSSSQIAHVNARAAQEPVRVDPAVFQLLRHAQRLAAETGGVFDITIAPLMRCWGLQGGTGKVPDVGELAEARSRVGMHLVQLDEERFTVRFARPGVMLDLGAVGKGHAVECAAELLREAGVESALIHGGTSTICAIGTPPDQPAWNVAIDYPPPSPDESPARLTTVPLKDDALSVSAVWGKSFQAGGRTYGHIIDPRTGEPAAGAVLAAVATASATESDALSTALLTLGLRGHARISQLRPGMRTLVLEPAAGARRFAIAAQGLEVRPLET